MEKVHAIRLLQASAGPDDISEFRLLVDHQHIKYVTVDPYIFDDMDLIFEPTLIEILRPLLPAGDWNHARIFRATSSENSSTGNAEVQVETSTQELPGILGVWHPLKIDYLELEVSSRPRSNMCEATCSKIPGQFIVKLARFHWEIAQLERETAAYKWIDGHNIGPEFLGHLTEHGRVIRFAISKIEEARHATPDDLDVCRQALRRLHTLGIKHGDTNKHNFLIHPHGVAMIDLEFAEQNATEAELNEELYGLEQQLADTSGKGGVNFVEFVDGTSSSDRVETGEQ
jgi:serine/threonine protein kinase